MIQGTFISHSGFLVELPLIRLLFDCVQEDLPVPEDKPLLVLVTHAHEDHFNPAVFRLDDGRREVQFILGADIALTAENCLKWGIRESTLKKCVCMAGNETRTALSSTEIRTYVSTDAGVAFLVNAGGVCIFHAGDLNWWHWEGEDPAWNADMEKKFKEAVQPLRGQHIHLAMLPLDPRLGKPGFWGADFYLRTADIDRFVPMHQWENHEFTETFLREYPQYREKAVCVSHRNESFSV